MFKKVCCFRKFYIQTQIFKKQKKFLFIIFFNQHVFNIFFNKKVNIRMYVYKF